MSAPLAFSEILRRALRCRCPRCATGRLFDGYLALKPQCPDCGLLLQRADSGDGPAVILTFLLGFVLVPPMLVIGLRSTLPQWLLLIIFGITIIFATLLSMRPAKALMVGLQFRYKPDMFEDNPS